MKKIAYIIGHRNSSDSCRKRNLLLVLKWLENIKKILKDHNICLKIIIIEQDDSPKIKIDSDEIIHTFIYNSEFYNRGWGFNVGFKTVNADYYFFADNDILLKNDDMINVFLKCFKYDAVKPYYKLYDTTDNYVNDIKFDPCNFNGLSCEYKKTFNKRSCMCFGGGIVGLSKQSVNVISGWDERFRGRGWEDYAFTAKMKLFLYTLHTFDFYAIHLWHNYETNTTKIINSDLDKEYQMYNVKNYVELIEKSCNFGLSLKYSQFGKQEKHTYNKFKYKERLKHANNKFNKIYDNIIKKYKPSQNKTKMYVYLDLCDQIDNINIVGTYESGYIEKSHDK